KKKKMNKNNASLITGWIRKNLDGCDNPRIHRKALTGNHSGQWRYRIGDYRIITEINDSEILILAVNVGHRRDIYKK
ncbi:MAG: type II toxin-antitoxin system RelE/ParE family toxin, partial [Bifidobacteriaceae bacterium]|nr:type II toxin-antitoxin system RelE/ParE family toxin [Bifidobacteriaceae bacterium]